MAGNQGGSGGVVRAKKGDPHFAYPPDGGCWFCFSNHGFLAFDREFDTYVHASCIKKTLAADPAHPEAELMKYLLERE